MMPSSLCQVVVVQRWESVQPRFQVRRLRPRSQRMVRERLAKRLGRVERVRVVCRRVVRVRVRTVRRDTVRSCCRGMGLVGYLGLGVHGTGLRGETSMGFGSALV